MCVCVFVGVWFSLSSPPLHYCYTTNNLPAEGIPYIHKHTYVPTYVLICTGNCIHSQLLTNQEMRIYVTLAIKLHNVVFDFFAFFSVMSIHLPKWCPLVINIYIRQYNSSFSKVIQVSWGHWWPTSCNIELLVNQYYTSMLLMYKIHPGSL